MRTRILDNDQERAEEILLLLARSLDVGDEWQYVELEWNGWLYAGWVLRSDDGMAEGHTLSIADYRH
jgi:hypothetical protein